MYQAIVFLPLLGAIIAGLIALVGARARFPGASPPDRAPTITRMDRRPRAMAPCRRTSTRRRCIRAMASRPSPSLRQPARARPSSITTGLLFIAMVLSWIAFAQVGFGHHDTRVPLFACIHCGRSPGRLGAARRHADRGDAGGGDDGLGLRPPLLDRLHGRGSVPAALLLLPVAVHLRDADAGDGRQPRRSCSSAGRASG